jgi:mRNA-degrading endonuclease toxin of MazEF toxin-antitoxin module
MSAPRFKRGDIVHCLHPHADSRNEGDASRRYALVVGDPVENANQDYILAQITSKEWRGRTDVWITSEDSEFAATGLRVPSTIRCHKLFAAAPSTVQRAIGIAGPQVLRKVDAALKVALQLS